jgi:hypothetical protein
VFEVSTGSRLLSGIADIKKNKKEKTI